MEFDKAKLAIKKMAEEIDSGTFTQKELTEFILAFRFDLFQSPDVVDSSKVLSTPYVMSSPNSNYGFALSCSCAGEENSCIECGPGFTTGFIAEDSGNIVKFKIKK